MYQPGPREFDRSRPSSIRCGAWLLAALVLLQVAQGCLSKDQRRTEEAAPSLLGLNLRDVSHDRWETVWGAASSLHPAWVRLDGQMALDEKGGLDFSFYDRWVDRFLSSGVAVLGQLGGARASCVRRVSAEEIANCPPDPLRGQAYSEYVEKVIRHFAGRVRYWESWNEPNDDKYWLGGSNPTAYARVLRIQHDAMKRANSNAKLIFAATSSGAQRWIQGVLAALGGDRPYEAVALHPYRFSGPHDQVPFIGPDGSQVPLDMKSELRERVALFRQYDSQHGRPDADPETWLTEYGWGAASPTRHEIAGGGELISYDAQARYLRETITLLHDPELGFVNAAFWWSATDLEWPGDNYGLFKSYGLLRKDLSRKPAADTFAELAAK